jgi:uncharacterized protein (TIGR03032 family)
MAQQDALQPSGDDTRAPTFTAIASRQLPEWLAEQRLSLAFTTYQTGKLFLIGLGAEGRLSIFERTFNRCMGLAASAQTLWMSSLYQLWRFENALDAGQLHGDYDRLYVPQVGYTTGDVDVHDVAIDSAGRPIFVSTLFSCLATISETHSFEALWKPRFISKLAAEDRCHLNGLALRDGRPAFVTAVSRSDAADGWRDHRRSGGVLVDVDSNEVIAEGFSMPHSPRWHRGALYLLDSGRGVFGKLDLRTCKLEEIAFCPGYARGLAFAGDYAVVGLSQPRGNPTSAETLTGLELDDALARRNVEPRAGLLVIDLRTGDAVHWLRLGGIVSELYDVAVLPGVKRPMALGFKTDEIRRTLRIKEPNSRG